MPTVSLFWNTNMAALFDWVTSCENALLTANDNDSVYRKLSNLTNLPLSPELYTTLYKPLDAYYTDHNTRTMHSCQSTFVRSEAERWTDLPVLLTVACTEASVVSQLYPAVKKKQIKTLESIASYLRFYFRFHATKLYNLVKDIHCKKMNLKKVITCHLSTL